MKYDNIMNLAKAHGFKKIMIVRSTWMFGSWCVVNEVCIAENGYGSAYGYTHYSNGNTTVGEIECAGNYSWRVVKVLDEKMKVTRIDVN